MKKIFSIVLLLAVALFAEGTQQVSKKEMYARARDALKEALVNKDLARASQALEYLQANVEQGAPLNRFEEYLVYSETEQYDKAIKQYAELRKAILDSGYTLKKEYRVTVNDGLNTYLYRDLTPFTKAKADSLCKRFEESTATRENKDLYATLIYSEQVLAIKTVTFGGQKYSYNVINDTTCADEFLNRANNFIKNYPMNEHATYLKEQTVPFIQKFMDNLRLFRRDPLAHKYYTGGLGVYVGQWLGFLSGSSTDVLDDKMGNSFILDADLQYKRFVLGFNMSFGMRTNYKDSTLWNNYGEEYDDENMFFTLGFVAYEMRFLKVTPFVGLGETYFMDLDQSISTRFAMGVNVDSHLLVKKPVYIGAFSFGLNARFKYMVSFGNLDLQTDKDSWNTKKYGAINHTFALELGLFMW
ncbi:MAG: hypothetical protein HUK19_09485 [Fibrobacter sp.]|nr:hypothetical protein [Fibrobacter sp.]